MRTLKLAESLRFVLNVTDHFEVESPGDSPPPGSPELPEITYKAKNVTVLQLLGEITNQTGATVRIEPHSVVIALDLKPQKRK